MRSNGFGTSNEPAVLVAVEKFRAPRKTRDTHVNESTSIKVGKIERESPETRLIDDSAYLESKEGKTQGINEKETQERLRYR